MSSAPGRVSLLLNLLFLLLLFSGCGGLPDYARPHLSSAGRPIPENSIPYRELTRSDFQAASVPARLSKHQNRLNAHTAVAIRPVAGAKYSISRGMIGDQQIYHGQVEHLAFEAVMIPGQSWWNPVVAKKRQPYVLQHEQIHFALMELAARKLTRMVTGDPLIASVYGRSAAEIRRELQQIIGQLIEESQGLALKSHTEFDEATSMQYNPKVQQVWHDRVMVELQKISGKGQDKPPI